MAGHRGTHLRFPRDERGVALLIAMLAIIMMGALITGTFFAGRMEMGAGRNAVYNAQATEAAEAGLTNAITGWDPAWNDYNLDVPTTQSVTNPISGNSSIRYTQVVRRLRGGNYLITSTGEKLDRNGNIMATRMLAKLAKLVTADIDIQAAVTAHETVEVKGSTTKVDGHDQLPAGWNECPAPDPTTGVYGIRTNETVTTSGGPDIQGVPAPMQLNDATVVDSIFQQPFATLSAATSIKLPGTSGTNVYSPVPTTTGSPSRCDRSNTNNWGEPYRTGGYVSQCITYFPVIWYPGSGTLKLTVGRAQGIILSSGDIDIAGNFEFDGIMLAMGSIDTHGTGNKVTGAVLSANANHINDDDTIAGTPTIVYSSCAIQQALTKSARGMVFADRPWAQIMAK